MKSKKKYLLLSLFFLLLSNSANAFPSSLIWTTCTTDVLSTGLGCFQTANFFTVINKKYQDPTFPVVLGFEVGLLSWRDWKVEVGIDYLGGSDYPLFFNAKMGIEEDKLFAKAPSFSVGGFWFGTRSHTTNYDVIDAIVGKTLPKWLSGGRIFLGTYFGTHTLGRDQIGYMLGYTKSFCQVQDKGGSKYWKWWLLADYASGKNFIGGGGVGIVYFFNSQAAVITGPTWFNDKQINGQWKWTVQINIFFTAFKEQIRKNDK